MAAENASPEAAAAAVLLAAARTCLGIVRRACTRPRRGPPLRRCPLCGSEAVGVLRYDAADAHGPVLQQCGQCGVWRELHAATSATRRHERALRADRTQIQRCAERLERGRILVETDAFAAALRDEVVSAEDLLALIAADTAVAADDDA